LRLLAAVNLRDEEADAVAEGAAAWAARGSAVVDLLFVEEVSPVPVWVTDPLSAQLLASQWDKVKADEDQRLQAILEKIPAALRGVAIRAEGRPAEVIGQRAVGYAAVVLAGRRHSTIGKALMGSVAARVVRTAPVPVLVLPGRDHLAPPPGEARPRVLLGVDLRAKDAGAGLAEARTWAARFDAVLDLVHVDSSTLHVPYILDPDVRARFEKEWDTMRRQDLAAMQSLLDTVPVENRGLPRVEEGDPAEALADVSREYDAIMVATHGRTGLQLLLVGSVAEKVIGTSKRPVLLLRA
jgi:nucleotide-binding universal stress UspA family protein